MSRCLTQPKSLPIRPQTNDKVSPHKWLQYQSSNVTRFPHVVEMKTTRMHSSRMRPVRCSGCLSCHACSPPRRHACHPAHACLPAMHTPPAMHALHHTCPLPCTSPPRGQIDTCENITFPNFVCGRQLALKQTRLAFRNGYIIKTPMQQGPHTALFTSSEMKTMTSTLRCWCIACQLSLNVTPLFTACSSEPLHHCRMTSTLYFQCGVKSLTNLYRELRIPRQLPVKKLRRVTVTWLKIR